MVLMSHGPMVLPVLVLACAFLGCTTTDVIFVPETDGGLLGAAASSDDGSTARDAGAAFSDAGGDAGSRSDSATGTPGRDASGDAASSDAGTCINAPPVADPTVAGTYCQWVQNASAFGPLCPACAPIVWQCPLGELPSFGVGNGLNAPLYLDPTTGIAAEFPTLSTYCTTATSCAFGWVPDAAAPNATTQVWCPAGISPSGFGSCAAAGIPGLFNCGE
jgi:hypothetical protein